MINNGDVKFYSFSTRLPSTCLTSTHLPSTCLTSTVQVNSEPSSRVTLVCIVLKLSGFLPGERAIRLLDDRWLVESSANELWAWLWDGPPSPPWEHRRWCHITDYNLSINRVFCLFLFFTRLGVEWAAASGKDSASLVWASCGSPGSVVMVIHLRDSNNTVTTDINDDCWLAPDAGEHTELEVDWLSGKSCIHMQSENSILIIPASIRAIQMKN